jgi:hypothetical protein
VVILSQDISTSRNQDIRASLPRDIYQSGVSFYSFLKYFSFEVVSKEVVFVTEGVKKFSSLFYAISKKEQKLKQQSVQNFCDD